MKQHKKITSLLLALVLSFSLCTSAFATNAQSPDEQQYYITALDENGSYVNYTITNDETCEVPLYSYATNEDGSSTRELTQVATLTFYTKTSLLGKYKLHFEFEPTNLAISLLTVGFTGTLTTYHNAGTRWSTNDYIGTLSGSCEAVTNGTGSLGGTYSVLGYEPVGIAYGVYT